MPGKSGKRLVVEFTIMRTFVDRPQFNRSHFVGKHLSSPLLPYYKGNEESNTLLNRNYLDMFN